MTQSRLLIALISLLAFSLVSCGGSGGQQADGEGAEKQAANQEPATLPQSGRSMQLKELPVGSPESIISDGTHYYVSNVGEKLEPSTKDGDGYIMKLDGEGNVVAEKFMEGLDAPKGSAIVDGMFYVADVDKVRIFDLATGEAAGEIDFAKSGTMFLNDLAPMGEGQLVVSATDVNRIYTIDLSDNSYEELVTRPTIEGPNGLCYDETDQALYVVNYLQEPKGVLGKVSVKEKDKQGDAYPYEQVNPFQGTLDGLAVYGDKAFVSDWNRQSILIMDLSSGQVGGFKLPAPVKGPADFYFDSEKGEIWLPGMQENTITIQTL